MSGITPAAMLSDYRMNCDSFMRGQASMFRAMSATEQRELLFYMNMHTSMTLMQLQAAMMRKPPMNGG